MLARGARKPPTSDSVGVWIHERLDERRTSPTAASYSPGSHERMRPAISSLQDCSKACRGAGRWVQCAWSHDNEAQARLSCQDSVASSSAGKADMYVISRMDLIQRRDRALSDVMTALCAPRPSCSCASAHEGVVPSCWLLAPVLAPVDTTA